MAARAIASGTISFGLVSIPVKLFSATQPSAGISFNLLHKKCGSRLKQQYVCPKDQETVERDDIVKGFQFAKDQYVTFTPEELKAIEETSTQSIDIEEFIPSDKIDPLYFDKPYYLAPDKGGDKPYALLAEVMRRTGRSALGKYAARGKQYLVLLRPTKDGLVMQQLLYADEVRSFEDVPVPATAVKENELKLATQLVEQSSSDVFDPQAYKDDVRERINDLIQRKVEGHEVSVAPQEAGKAQIIDLMDALKASLAKRKPARAATQSAESPRVKAEAGNAGRRQPQPASYPAAARRVRAAKK
jgi:DNA end-binding protein Ku